MKTYSGDIHRAAIHTIDDTCGMLELDIEGDVITLRVGHGLDPINYPIDGSADACLRRTFLKFARMIREAQKR